MKLTFREGKMEVGDIVVRKSYDKDITFKIIDIKEVEGKPLYVLKGISIRIIADAFSNDLEEVDEEYIGTKEKILNSRVNDAINKAIGLRGDIAAREAIMSRGSKSQKQINSMPNKELMFGRPGKILHIDGDKDYLERCLRYYNNINLMAMGICEEENNVPLKIREYLEEISGKDLAVIITDTQGRAFRVGAIGTAIGCSGINPLWVRVGEEDLFGRALETTEVATADELAAAASLLMGQANEGIPIVLIRGFEAFDHLRDTEIGIKPLLRPKEFDVFRK